MKHFFISLALFALIALTTEAQRVYFCESYTEDGDPVGINSAWTITADAGYVYVLFNQADVIQAEELVFSIDKLLDGSYKSYSTRYVKNDPKKKWALLDYNFTEDGSYKVSVGAGGNVFASEYVSISWKAPSDTDDNDVLKFIESDISVCKDVANELPIGQSETFTLEPGGNNLYVYADIMRTIDSDEVILDIYKKDTGTGNFEFKDSMTYTVTSSWEKLWLKYFFTEPGDYEISVYTKENVWVNTCYITLY